MAVDQIEDWERKDSGVLAWFIQLQNARREGKLKAEAYCRDRLARLGVFVKFADQVPVLTIAEMLDGLRSDDPVTRLQAGCLLSRSIGAGLALQGVPAEDVEHGAVGKDITGLLARAMSGETEAVDTLERVLSTTPPTEAPKRNAVPREVQDA